MVGPPMQSTSGNNHRTYTFYMSPPLGSYAHLAVSLISESMAIETRGPRIHGGHFRDFWYDDVHLWCDTPSLRTGILAFDLCGNMSWGAKPHFSASWGLGSMPIKSWFRRYEFMVLADGKPILWKWFSKASYYIIVKIEKSRWIIFCLCSQ